MEIPRQSSIAQAMVAMAAPSFVEHGCYDITLGRRASARNHYESACSHPFITAGRHAAPHRASASADVVDDEVRGSANVYQLYEMDSLGNFLPRSRGNRCRIAVPRMDSTDCTRSESHEPPPANRADWIRTSDLLPNADCCRFPEKCISADQSETSESLGVVGSTLRWCCRS